MAHFEYQRVSESRPVSPFLPALLASSSRLVSCDLTCLLHVLQILHAPEDPGQARLAHAMFTQQDDFDEVIFGVAPRGDDGVGGVGGPALAVAWVVGGVAHQLGEVAGGGFAAELLVVGRHASSVELLMNGEGQAAPPLLQALHPLAAVQGHRCKANIGGVKTSRSKEHHRTEQLQEAPTNAFRGSMDTTANIHTGEERGEGGIKHLKPVMIPNPIEN